MWSVSSFSAFEAEAVFLQKNRYLDISYRKKHVPLDGNGVRSDAAEGEHSATNSPQVLRSTMAGTSLGPVH
jgi:hypothetical protein